MCPACKQDLGEAAGVIREAPAAVASARPAHLALLEPGSGGVEVDAEGRVAKPRLVSRTGPAVPVVKQQNDSVPAGWMQRLEAARMMISSPGSEPPPSPEPAEAAAPSRPPPLRSSSGASAPAGFDKKPAHLLVAQLEEEEQRRRAREAARSSEAAEEPADEIARVEIPRPAAAKPKRRVPDVVIWGLLGALVLGGVGYAYSMAQQEPAPTATVDPKLVEAAERRRAAIVALEEGNGFVAAGKGSADKAIAAYQRALSLEGTLAKAERGLAIAHAAKDDNETAVHHYRRYLDLDPEAKDAEEVREIIRKWEKAQGGATEGARADEAPAPSPVKRKKKKR